MILHSVLTFTNFSLYVLEFCHSPVHCSSKEIPVLSQVSNCLGQPCSQRSCTPQLCKIYSLMYLFQPLVASLCPLWQSKVLLHGIGYWVCISPFIDWGMLASNEHLAFSVPTHGWQLCFSGMTPSPGCCLVWWSWGDAWGLGSVGLCLHRNRDCQMCVSQLVLFHPSNLVVY